MGLCEAAVRLISENWEELQVGVLLLNRPVIVRQQ